MAACLMEKLNEAFEILKDPIRRQKYSEMCAAHHKHSYDKKKAGNEENADTNSCENGGKYAAKKTSVIKMVVTLEELYGKCVKEMKVREAGEKECRKLVVKLHPLFKTGTRLLFETPRNKVLVELVEQPHARFVRREQDLLYHATFSFEQATMGFPTTLTLLTLDLRVLEVPVNGRGGVIVPNSLVQVCGEGLPAADDSRGSLFVRCHVLLPHLLSHQQRALLHLLLEFDNDQAKKKDQSPGGFLG